MAPAWMVVIIVGREFVVSGLRTILATHGITLPASIWGKLKTTCEVVAIVLLIFTNTLDRLGHYAAPGIIALWLAMLVALGSAAHYIARFIRLAPALTDGRRSDAPRRQDDR